MDFKRPLEVHGRSPPTHRITADVLAIGATLVETVASIIATIEQLNANQATAAQALNEQVTRIADEVAQWEASRLPSNKLIIWAPR